jgi:hypothetical protein
MLIVSYEIRPYIGLTTAAKSKARLLRNYTLLDVIGRVKHGTIIRSKKRIALERITLVHKLTRQSSYFLLGYDDNSKFKYDEKYVICNIIHQEGWLFMAW